MIKRKSIRDITAAPKVIPKKPANPKRKAGVNVGGRPPLPEAQRKKYSPYPISLRKDQIDNLIELAEFLGVKSRRGVNHGKPSWRTMIAAIAENAPSIINASKRMAKSNDHYSITIKSDITIVIGDADKLFEIGDHARDAVVAQAIIEEPALKELAAEKE